MILSADRDLALFDAAREAGMPATRAAHYVQYVRKCEAVGSTPLSITEAAAAPLKDKRGNVVPQTDQCSPRHYAKDAARDIVDALRDGGMLS